MQIAGQKGIRFNFYCERLPEGLIPSENQARILEVICDGKMTSSEWKSSIQTKVLKNEGKVDDAESDQED